MRTFDQTCCAFGQMRPTITAVTQTIKTTHTMRTPVIKL